MNKFKLFADRATRLALIDALESGICPWSQDWVTNHPVYNLEGHIYRGINFFLLTAVQHRFTSPIFTTFKKIEELGAHIVKGEHGTKCVFWNGRDVSVYTVFNLDQIGGLPQDFQPPKIPDSELLDGEALPIPAPSGQNIIWGMAAGFYAARVRLSSITGNTYENMVDWRDILLKKSAWDVINCAQIAQGIADDMLSAENLIGGAK